MRVFYDTEFRETGPRNPIEFISIGMVDEDGSEYYAISSQVAWHAVFGNVWLRENVLPHLPGKIKDFHNGGGTFEPDESSGLYKPRGQIAEEVSEFCYHRRGSGQPGLWAYYADYDHVVLAQLFGRMVDLPSHMPMYTRDLKQLVDMLMPGWEMPQQEGDEHNALADARWVRDRFSDVKQALVGSKVGALIEL